MWPAPNWLNSSVGRALHWHFIGHGFESFLHVGLYLFLQQLIVRIPATINHVISFIAVQIYDLPYIHLFIMLYKGVVAQWMWRVTLQWSSILSRSASCHKSHPVMHQPDNWQLIFFFCITPNFPPKYQNKLTLLSPISQEHSAAAFNASTCSQSSVTSHIQQSDKSFADEWSSDKPSSWQKGNKSG